VNRTKGEQLSQKDCSRDAAEWFRRCKRAGFYEQGKLLYEKGGLNIDNLTKDALVNVEEAYPCLCPYAGQCW
jgi:hypothetical protein